MLFLTRTSISAVAMSLALTAPLALAEDAATAEEATTTSVETSTGAVVVPTQSRADMMRAVLIKNREKLLNGRNDKNTSRGGMRTLKRTELLQKQRNTQVKIKDRQFARQLRRNLEPRLGGPNSGIRRQGIEQDVQRVDVDETRQPVGRMRLFPGLFEN